MLLLVALLGLPVAPAQPDATFDPLVFDFHGYLTTAGAVAPSAPDAGAVAFAAVSPPATAQPLRFAFDAPIRFSPGEGFDVTLTLRADQPILARDADGNALELAIEANGTPVEGTARRVALGNGILAPGDTVTVSALLQAPAARFDEGTTLALVVRPLVAALPENGLLVVVGGDTPSRLDALTMRVPAADDLRLQTSALTSFVLATEDFRPERANAVVIDVRVGHGPIRVEGTPRYDANGTYVVVRGEEDDADARSHALLEHDARVEAAHELRVGGVLVRAHPGIGVVVPVTRSNARIDCVRNCEPFAIPIGGDATVVTDPRSVLVPPPRDTSGIPTSEDEPASGRKGLPLPALALVATALTLAAFGRQRR